MSTSSPIEKHLDCERAELEAVLGSELFGRSSNLSRFLGFVCEKYFAGDTDAIKEYSIAVEALGRPVDFDPQSDTIVRVTAHALRKRLEEFYRSAGAEHAIQICLPAGHYVPRFIHRGNGRSHSALDEPTVAPEQPSEVDRIPAPNVASGSFRSTPASGERPRRSHSIGTVLIVGLVLLALVLVIIPASRRWVSKDTGVAASATTSANSTTEFDRSFRSLVGENRPSYTDRAGYSWQLDRICTGGTSFTATDRPILGTEDRTLFLGGRSGTFQCRIPVPAGKYEAHLYFAETAGLQENARYVVLSINGAAPVTLDVVDDAAGDDIAIVKVFPGIQPEADGTIHIDFTSPQSFLNALEIVPAPKDVVPVRIVTGHSVYRDSQGNVWLPDRYFFGGRQSRYSGDMSNMTDGGLYEWQRMGHFRYVVPVAPGHRYTVKLYFRELWFGAHNGNAGGAGSRLFDVACNGQTLLRDFDILGDGNADTVVRTFRHIQPTAQGKIELTFTPVVNYPSVNALEVIPE